MFEYTTKIGSDGRIVLPAACRKALQLQSGDSVVIYVEDDEARLMSLPQAIKKAQAKVKQYNKSGRKLSEMLINQRREEASRE